jgi:2',3'-cyclic-nucleotide 3'-phosphodiesterase
VTKTLSDLIDFTLPAKLKSAHTEPLPSFFPHITLTSGFELEASQDPQTRLNSLSLPVNQGPNASFLELDCGNKWTKKLFIRVMKETLAPLAAACQTSVHNSDSRQAKVGVQTEWDPHVSLVYSDMEITEDILQTCKEIVLDTGVCFGGDDPGRVTGWKSGSVWLVPTFLKVKDWRPVAAIALH